MAKYRLTIRVICFVLLLVSLILKAILFIDNNLVMVVIYPFSFIALWLMLDRYVFKDRSKKVEMTNTEIIKHANYIYWTIYIVGFVLLEIAKVAKISSFEAIFTFIICGAEFKEESIAWIYKKLKEHQLHNETTKALVEIEDKKE